MDNRKIIVILLLITLVLSIASVAITLNFDKIFESSSSNVGSSNAGNIQLVVEKPLTNSQEEGL